MGVLLQWSSAGFSFAVNPKAAAPVHGSGFSSGSGPVPRTLTSAGQQGLKDTNLAPENQEHIW